MKKNSGVTLIALVITIIVLIIIAGVGTYSGIDTLKDAKGQKQIAELNMLKQPVLENYTKYITTNDNKYIIGEEVSYADMQTLISEINEQAEETISLKATSGYYRLSTTDLQNMEVSEVEDIYIVNYQTGEIINETLKVTERGIPLYTYANEINLENTEAITMTPDSQDSYAQSIEIQITIPTGFSDVKYKWTNILKQPEISEFVEDIPSTNIVTTPTGVKGNYYLWIYAKDTNGNDVITHSSGYMIDSNI